MKCLDFKIPNHVVRPNVYDPQTSEPWHLGFRVSRTTARARERNGKGGRKGGREGEGQGGREGKTEGERERDAWAVWLALALRPVFVPRYALLLASLLPSSHLLPRVSKMHHRTLDGTQEVIRAHAVRCQAPPFHPSPIAATPTLKVPPNLTAPKMCISDPLPSQQDLQGYQEKGVQTPVARGRSAESFRR